VHVLRCWPTSKSLGVRPIKVKAYEDDAHIRSRPNIRKHSVYLGNRRSTVAPYIWRDAIFVSVSKEVFVEFDDWRCF
jgi:hypothetical protein